MKSELVLPPRYCRHRRTWIQLGSQRMHIISLAGALATAFMVSASNAETRTFDISDFDQIEVSTGIRAEISIGDEFSVKVDSKNPEHFEELKVNVSGSRLKIALSRGLLGLSKDWMWGGPEITAYIVAPIVSGIEVDSGARVEASAITGKSLETASLNGAQLTLLDIEVDVFTGQTSGGASMDASGSCRNLDAVATGGARLRLGDLRCEAARVRVTSGSKVSAFVSRTIEIEVSSGGRLSVAGQPKVTDMDVSSGGDVKFD
ncbi:MAG: DUF2807 domain-containing protein [Gammaproteobacteria bacterium]|nr:DUF2807 domain-containing protein [Gammaproteobacteria bacterium]